MSDISVLRPWSKDLKDTADFFTQRSSRYGPGFEAAHWGSQRGQIKRFEVLTGSWGDLSGAGLLDVGCGVGDLLDFLMKAGNKPKNYLGVDISRGMIERAGKRFEGLDGVDFMLGLLDELPAPKYDYVVASGIFYRVRRDGYGFMKQMIPLLFGHATAALGFNTLTTWDPREAGDEFRADPARVLSVCGELTNRIIFRHDYHPGDGTFLLYR